MHKRNGFTIIELLIVLALAGLMMLVVFVAVPATQRAARNNNRHGDVGLLLAAVAEAKTNSSNGALPDSCDSNESDCFLSKVSRSYYQDAGAEAVVKYVKLDHAYTDTDSQLASDDADATEKIVIYSYAVCDESDTMPTGQGASSQSVVAQYALETFGGVAMQCRQL